MHLKANPVTSPLEFEDELYIGVDLSLTHTGITVMHEDRSIIKVYAIKTTRKDGLDDQRVLKIAERIMSVIEEYSDTNKVRVGIEAIPFSKRGATGKIFTRYGLFQVLKYLLMKAGIETYVIGPTTVKNRFAGKGNVDKDAVIKAIFTKYKLTIKDDNVADAFACASLVISYVREKLKLSIERVPMAD